MNFTEVKLNYLKLSLLMPGSYLKLSEYKKSTIILSQQNIVIVS